jgi:hypothetical protein
MSISSTTTLTAKANSKLSHIVLDLYPELTKAPDLEKLPHEFCKMKIVYDSLCVGQLLGSKLKPRNLIDVF